MSRMLETILFIIAFSQLPSQCLPATTASDDNDEDEGDDDDDEDVKTDASSSNSTNFSITSAFLLARCPLKQEF
jgi:hypothetical protein